MSRRYGFHAVVLAVACAPFVVAGCIEPSGLSKPNEIYEAFAMRDGGGGAGGSGGSGSGGSGGGTPDAMVSQEGGPPAGPCGDDVLEDLIKPRCATAGCHNAATGGVLNFEASDLATELIDAEASALCEDHVYIDSADPQQSLIYLKLSTPPPCGSRMPAIGAELDDEEKACILDFIEELNAGQ